MDLSLYECRMWPHRFRKNGQAEWEICVSEPIYGNQNRTAVQFHLVVMRAGAVVRPSDVVLEEREAGAALEALEHMLRAILRGELVWDPAGCDRGTVKVWYYAQDGGDPTANGKQAIPLRICLTALGIQPLTLEQERRIQNRLEEAVFQWLFDTPRC